MSVRDEEIIEQILEYIQDERYRQAILIDGEWGTGKTFFVKERLIQCLKQRVQSKKIYYISLYGISSTEQIMDEFYSSMVEEIIEEKYGKNKGKVIEKGISVTSKLVAAGMKYFNLDSKDLPQLSDIIELKEVIIIFDDLERCDIDVNKILGILNNLVEHNNIKIILVANQIEIGKMNFSKELSHKYLMSVDERIKLDEKGSQNGDKVCFTKEQLIRRAEQLFSEDFFYKKVKEKLIGLTILYQPNLLDIIEDIIRKYIKEEKTIEYLLQNKQQIVNIFEEKGHHNIRTLIFGLIAFDKFYNIIKDIEFEPNVYVKDELKKVLKYTMISAIQIKSGKVVYSWEKGTSKSGMVHYDKKNYYNSGVYGYKFVDDYLLQCKLEEKDVKEVILENVNEIKVFDESKKLKNSLQFKKLHFWWELEDEEIDKISENIICELQEKKYSPRYFKEIIITLMQIEFRNIKTFDYKNYIEPMKQKLMTYTEKFEIRYLEVLSDDEKFVEDYNKIVEPLIEILKNREKEEKKEDSDFLCDQNTWDDSFANKCNEHKEEYISGNKFFYYIDPEKFIEQIKQTKVVNIYNFLDGISTVYSFSNLNEFFKQDVMNLKCIINKIDIDTLSQGKKTRKMALEKLKSKLQEYLELIEKPVYII